MVSTSHRQPSTSSIKPRIGPSWTQQTAVALRRKRPAGRREAVRLTTLLVGTLVMVLTAALLGGSPASAATTTPPAPSSESEAREADPGHVPVEQISAVIEKEVDVAATVVRAAETTPGTLDYELALEAAGGDAVVAKEVAVGWALGGGAVVHDPDGSVYERVNRIEQSAGVALLACSGRTDSTYRSGVLNSWNYRLRLNSCDLNLLRSLIIGGATASGLTGFILSKIPTPPTVVLGILATIAGFQLGFGAAIVSACGYRGNGANFYYKGVPWCTPQ